MRRHGNPSRIKAAYGARSGHKLHKNSREWSKTQNRKQIYEEHVYGSAELIAERKTEWFAEGIAKGERNKAVATAKKALNRNIPITVIADLTDLPLEEIERLQ